MCSNRQADQSKQNSDRQAVQSGKIYRIFKKT